jgi:GNAT superfamily N-acetyltransferase
MQLELPSAKQPTTWVPGKPEFRWEPFSSIVRELPPLFRRHWREIALNQDKIPLDPNWELYFTYEVANVLHVLTVRDQGVLVGYVFMLVHPHLHYASSTWAQTDIYWLDPAYRFGWTGVRMFRAVEHRMRVLKVEQLLVNVKLHFEAERGTVGKLLERLGYKPFDMLYGKYIG